jgi:hypothetical protein
MRRGARSLYRLALALGLAAVLVWPELSLGKVHRRGHAATHATPTSVANGGTPSRNHKKHARARAVASFRRKGMDSAVALPQRTTSSDREHESAAAAPRRAGYQGTTNVGSDDAPIWKVTIDGR